MKRKFGIIITEDTEDANWVGVWCNVSPTAEDGPRFETDDLASLQDQCDEYNDIWKETTFEIRQIKPNEVMQITKYGHASDEPTTMIGCKDGS